MNPAT